MRKGEAAGRSVMRLAYLSAAVAVLGVIVLRPGSTRSAARRRSAQSARAEAQDRLGVLRSDLQGTLDANIEMARALAGVVRYQPGIDQADVQPAGRGADRGTAINPHTRGGAGPRGAHGLSAGAEHEAVTRPRPPRAARRGRGGGAGAGSRADRARGPARPDRGRARLHRAHAGLRRRGPERGAAVLGHRLRGHRPGRRSTGRAGSPTPTSALDVALIGRDGRLATATPFFGDPAVLRQDPVTAEVSAALGRLADRRGAEGRLAAAAGALGAARALRAGGLARRGADHRRGAARSPRARPRWR